MTVKFKGPVWYWKGPAPHYFVSVPPKESEDLKAILRSVTYGWGMIPVTVKIGKTEWNTAMFPKDGGYIVPIKLRVRKAERIEEGDVVSLQFEIVQAGP